MSDHDESGLDALRRRIDEVDRRLVELLNERARVVVEIGKHKQGSGTPIYAPAREAEVLAKVLDASAGPLPPRTVEAVYRELMSGSFALEQPLRIGYLGPRGSFSHAACVAHFGRSVTFVDAQAIEGVFAEVVRGHVDYGLVPIENSIGGGIVETLDAFRDGYDEVSVYAEVQMSIRHNLLGRGDPGRRDEIRRIHSKPEVFAQCRRWVREQVPNAVLVPEASSSRAVQIAAEADDPAVVAIGSALAGELYGMPVLFASIEDDPNNLTRFFVLARQRAGHSGDDKTTISFRTKDEPGALVRVLAAFEAAGVNLTHIDKRPSGRENWTYTFFVDALGHRDDPAMQRAVEGAGQMCERLRILGSYPRSRRVL